MPFMTWNESLSVNVREIDEQHKTMVQMINDLHRAMKNREGCKTADILLEKLKSYARNHFSLEEKYMAKFNFEGFQDHRVEHDKFVEKILDWDLESQEGSNVNAVEMMGFLRNWLLKHIQGTDKQYSACFNENGLF